MLLRPLKATVLYVISNCIFKGRKKNGEKKEETKTEEPVIPLETTFTVEIKQ